MLADPAFAYQQIGGKFGLTRQRIARIATELGIDGWQRQRERMLRRGSHIVIKSEKYPEGIRSVIDKIERSGIRVTPHIFPPSQSNIAWKSQKMVIANGVLCTIRTTTC
jgi:hypothetical protein